jgi:preprotein translocase subunit SecA
MGLEGDVAIESRMVSKTVENAQSRVEGYNFDMRKRIVEYDDVINKQRERIYEERDKVLHNEDLSETVLAFVDQELEGIIDAHLSEVEAEWDLDGLAEALAALGLDGEAFSADELDALDSRQEIIDYISDQAAARLDEREQEYGEETWSLVERAVLLRAIDTLWVEHLTELEDFRKGVGLRGYGGRDPLVEFKREAFSLYDELRGFIRHQVASTIFRVSVQQREAVPAQEPRSMPMLTPEQLAKLRSGNGGAAQPAAAAAAGGRTAGTVTPSVSSGGSATSTSGAAVTTRIIPGLQPQTPQHVQLQKGDETLSTGPARAAGQPPDGEKVGRNDPCWCGSGKKFKRCHGAA